MSLPSTTCRGKISVGTLRGDFNDLRGEFKDLQVQFEQKFREMLVTMMQLVIGGFLVGILAIVAVAFIR